jgi:hypothetical protein
MVVARKVRVILKHCPKIASAKPNRHLRANLKDVRSSMACVGGADCRKGKLRADRRVKSNEAGNAAIPQDLSSHNREDRCAPL